MRRRDRHDSPFFFGIAAAIIGLAVGSIWCGRPPAGPVPTPAAATATVTSLPPELTATSTPVMTVHAIPTEAPPRPSKTPVQKG